MVSRFSLKPMKAIFAIANTTVVDGVVVSGSLVWLSVLLVAAGLRSLQGEMHPHLNELFLLMC